MVRPVARSQEGPAVAGPDQQQARRSGVHCGARPGILVEVVVAGDRLDVAALVTQRDITSVIDAMEKAGRAPLTIKTHGRSLKRFSGGCSKRMH